MPPVLGRDGLHQRRLRVEAVPRPAAAVHRGRGGRGHAGHHLQDHGDAAGAEEEAEGRGEDAAGQSRN